MSKLTNSAMSMSTRSEAPSRSVKLTSHSMALTTCRQSLRNLEPRKIARVCCLILSMVFITGMVAFSVVWSGILKENVPLKSLSSVYDVKPVPRKLLQVLKTPGSQQVIYHVNLSTCVGADCIQNTEPIVLLVLVESLPTSYDIRMAIRHSWMQYSSSALVHFVVPGKEVPEETLKRLKEESAAFKDLVVFLDAKELPQSVKLLYEFAWAEQAINYLYLMKTSEQFYVRTKELVEELRKMQNDSMLYWGYFEGRRRPTDKGKHPEPHWFLCDTFIRYAHAGGYIVSRPVVKRLLSVGKYLQLYNNEDVAVGTWLSPYKDINWKHDVLFDTEVGASRGCRNSFVVFPTNSSSDMASIHQRLTETGRHCLGPEAASGYEYNFNKLPAKCCSR